MDFVWVVMDPGPGAMEFEIEEAAAEPAAGCLTAWLTDWLTDDDDDDDDDDDVFLSL